LRTDCLFSRSGPGRRRPVRVNVENHADDDLQVKEDDWKASGPEGGIRNPLPCTCCTPTHRH
jgi:hypothetical protein